MNVQTTCVPGKKVLSKINKTSEQGSCQEKGYAYGQVQKIWPQRPKSSEKLGKWLFIVAGVLKICVVGLSSCTPKIM